MAASRIIPATLRAAPVVALALLIIWTAVDLVGIGGGGSTWLLEVLAVAAAILVVATALRWAWLRPTGLVVLGAAYMLGHAFFLGVEVVSALLFLVVAIGHVELRIVAERFAPLFEANLAAKDRVLLNAAIARAFLRLTLAALLAFVVPIVAAELAVAGVVPVTTIPTAVILAGGLVFVVVILALLPSLERHPA